MAIFPRIAIVLSKREVISRSGLPLQTHSQTQKSSYLALVGVPAKLPNIDIGARKPAVMRVFSLEKGG